MTKRWKRPPVSLVNDNDCEHPVLTRGNAIGATPKFMELLLLVSFHHLGIRAITRECGEPKTYISFGRRRVFHQLHVYILISVNLSLTDDEVRDKIVAAYRPVQTVCAVSKQQQRRRRYRCWEKWSVCGLLYVTYSCG